MITGLPIDGKQVVVDNKPFKIEDCFTLIWVKPSEGKKKEIALSNLVSIINEVDDNPDDVALNKTCRATTLLGIGRMVDNNSNCTILSKYEDIVRDVDDTNFFFL
jgi:hypothetical protein